ALSADVDAATTTLTVDNATYLGVIPGYSTLRIGTETLLVTGIPDGVFGNTLTAQRGYDCTAPASHAAGDAVHLGTDQRGYARVVNGVVDAGAFEVQTVSSVQIAASSTESGLGTPLTFTATSDQTSGTIRFLDGPTLLGGPFTVPASGVVTLPDI